ncbi:hypothetical protein V3C99_003415, partial [Haemonchus contortus]
GCPPSAGPGAVYITVQKSSIPSLTISYKDKNELFTQLKDALTARNVPLDILYALDGNFRRMPIDNPDNLFVVSNGSSTVRLYSKAASDDYNHYPGNKAHPGKSRSSSSSSDTSHSSREHSRYRHQKYQSKHHHCPCQSGRFCGYSISSPFPPCHPSSCCRCIENAYQMNGCSRCHTCCC